MNRETLGFTQEQADAIVTIIRSKCIPTLDGCLERQKTPNKDGYTNYRYGKKVYGAHRLMYMLCVGLKYADSVVMHKCDNRRCVNIDHLMEGTSAMNTYDCIVKHRTDWQAKPIEPVVPKVANESRYHSLKVVFDVLRARILGRPIDDIAIEMGVSKKTIVRWMVDLFGTINIVAKPVVTDDLEQGVYLEKTDKKPKAKSTLSEKRELVLEANRKKKESDRKMVADMYRKGMSVYEIAGITGISVSGCRDSVICELGVIPKAVKPSKEDMAADLKAGMNYEEVAVKYGVSTGTVRTAEKMFAYKYRNAVREPDPIVWIG